MISPEKLLNDLKRWVSRLEDDLRERCKELPEVDETFRGAYAQAKSAGRTAHPYETWLDQELTQVAVGWILATVFVRFLEDNALIDQPWISGPGERRTLAAEVKEQYFKQFPTAADNDYLQHAFEEVAKLPGMADLFDKRHNPLWQAKISGDAASALIEFWRKIDNASGELLHDFSDSDWNTRFLGDLYENLSEDAQTRFALRQTPDFVEAFILDRTLDPAIDTFGYKTVRMIDPACGSGHFLLGGFARMLEHFRKGDDRLSPKEVASLALGAIHGVDINPFAVAIARFRLLLEAWKYAGVSRLRAAPAFKLNLAVGDALFHSPVPGEVADTKSLQLRIESANASYGVEDASELAQIFGQKYHAVVANPPYIIVHDKALNKGYRSKFASCKGKYSMSVPFMELIFDLAVKGDIAERKSAGFTGQITSNSFMKRAFGNKLIEDFIPYWDLTHIIDTSGAYLPGHGTPTVILFGKNQKPTKSVIRTISGVKGEEGTPENASLGLVWTSILNQIDLPDSESEWTSSTDLPRDQFSKHPWSLGGGAIQKILQQLVNGVSNNQILDDYVSDTGMTFYSGADEVFLLDVAQKLRLFADSISSPLLTGSSVRDYQITSDDNALVPYKKGSVISLKELPDNICKHFWAYRCPLQNRLFFGKKPHERSMAFYEPSIFFFERYDSDQFISYSYVATHNHFIKTRRGSASNRHSPQIWLRDCSALSVNDVCAYLNSSIALFWARQKLFCKRGDPVGRWGEFIEWDGTKLKQFPMPTNRPEQLAANINDSAQQLSNQAPKTILNDWQTNETSLADVLLSAKSTAASLRALMVALQDELDWQCYRLYGLVSSGDDLEWPEDRLDELPGLLLGQRAFEIQMARDMEAGKLETVWFDRHSQAGSKPTTEIPDDWPADYKALVERRLQCIAENKNINLIERPEYKRRWNTEPWETRQEDALRQWLLARLESYFHDADRMIDLEDEVAHAAVLDKLKASRNSFAAGQGLALCSTKQLADAAQLDPQWMEAAQVYTDNPAFDVPKLVRELVEKESVPYLPSQRYKESGLRNRLQWERTWELQRQEDAIETRVKKDHPEASEERLKDLIRDAQQAEVGDIPVPPKYKSKDFKKTSYWNLRGKLDVPKERWTLFPGTERSEDPSPVIAWAGWDHKQQIQALGAYYYERQNQDGWDEKRLLPLLAGMKDLIPWVEQWHPGIDPEFGQNLAEFYEGFIRDQLHDMNLTEADLEKERIGE